MGTRGVYGFRKDGKDKLGYSQYDSYPTGWPIEAINFIKETSDEELKEIADRIILVTNDTPPTDEQVKECAKFTDLNVSNQSTEDWYCLLRDAQGDFSAYKTLSYMMDNADFIKDSLFCEFAYIINLDEGVFEIYQGFNKKPGGKGRYAGEFIKRDYSDDKYYGVVLFKAIPLDEVRKIEKADAFMEEISEEMCQEEEA